MLCDRGHQTEPPASATYEYVVSSNSVRIAIIFLVLDDIYILIADIHCAYIMLRLRKRYGYNTEHNLVHGEDVLLSFLYHYMDLIVSGPHVEHILHRRYWTLNSNSSLPTRARG